MPSPVGAYVDHVFKSIALITLSFIFLPLSSIVVAIALASQAIWDSPIYSRRRRIRRDPEFRPRRILVTGVGMTKGLCLARAFYKEGHEVVGADFEPGNALVCGRVSATLLKFYRLPSPQLKSYGEFLRDIVLRERIELWVSCSGVVSAVEDGEAKQFIERVTDCVAIQFDAETTRKFHEKDSFIAHVSGLGLAIPETHAVTSTEQALERLTRQADKRKFVMKPIGVDDARRADMTLLPLSTRGANKRHLSGLQIAKDRPYILQQFITGREYCTQALIVGGKVKAFLACPSAELLMHYEPLPSESPVVSKMLQFTETVAHDGGPDFTGHLSFDFLCDKDDDTPYPIECNPRCHTAVALFDDKSEVLVKSYLTALFGKASKSGIDDTPLVVCKARKRYWQGHDLFTLVLLQLCRLSMLQVSLAQFFHSLRLFLEHLVFWSDGTFETYDPLPWWWLYHVYWPMVFFNCLIKNQQWSRINVSTTKIFAR